MSKNILSLSVSDTENCSMDNENKPVKVKKTYKKKYAISDKDMEELQVLDKVKILEDEINNQFETIKKLKNLVKDIKQSYQQDITKVRKIKRQKENSNTTGFNKKIILPDKFCELVGLDKKAELTIPQFTQKVYQELRKRNLVYDKDKRIYRVDKQFMEVLDIKESVNKSTNYPDENGLNIGTMLTYVNNAFKKHSDNKDKDKEVEIVKKEKILKNNDDNETKIKVSNKLVKNKNSI